MIAGPALPVLFLTHDGDAEVAITVINNWQRLWPKNPLHFIVPTQSDGQTERYQQSVDSTAGIHFVRTAAEIGETLATLCRTALEFEDSEWFLWASSDRCPVALSDWLTSTLCVKELPSDVSSIRLTRWKDSHQLDAVAGCCEITGAVFSRGPLLFHGFWHPQLVTRNFVHWLSSVAVSGPRNSTIREWQPVLDEKIRSADLATCYPATNLAKFDEPTIEGLPTLSHALRCAYLGQPLPRKTQLLPALVGGFGNPATRNANYFWGSRSTRIKAEDLPEWKFPALPVTVVSFGGCGSKMVVKWLYGRADKETKRLAHTHHRIPPLTPPTGKVLYVFGDPRNTILSFFSRRESLTHLHGMDDISATSFRPGRRDWCLAALQQLESSPEAMDETWDLQTYLANGVDLFRLEEHFDTWLYSPLPYKVFFLRYEMFWSVAGNVERQFELESGPIPVKRERRANWISLPQDQRDLVENMYSGFAQRLSFLPDFFVVDKGCITDLSTRKRHAVSEV
jgi:hypothetical protein